MSNSHVSTAPISRPERCEKGISPKRELCVYPRPQRARVPEGITVIPPQPSPPETPWYPCLLSPSVHRFLAKCTLTGRRKVGKQESRGTWEAAWSGRKSHKADSGSSERKTARADHSWSRWPQKEKREGRREESHQRAEGRDLAESRDALTRSLSPAGPHLWHRAMQTWASQSTENLHSKGEPDAPGLDMASSLLTYFAM